MRSPLSYLTFWFVPLLVRFNVYLGATKGLFCVHFLGDRHDFGASHRSRVLSRTAMGRVRGAGDAFGRFSFSAVSSVSSMVVMARMSQNVLVTLRNSFFLGLRSIRCFL